MIDLNQWEQIQKIFTEVFELHGDERDQALTEACNGDEVLEKEVRALLDAHDTSDQFLKDTASEDVFKVIEAKERLKESNPEIIGPYRIEGQIGLGGMGAVHKATQLEPVQRTVALKIMSAGMNREAFLARFQYEHQALAMMNHPNIAHVYDAGTTLDGRPYFTMEYIEGEPITDYCDKRSLSIQKRLNMFLQVCDGVLHAHRRGLIHRDLKPSNILVTEDSGIPVPKIIDFGIAKASQPSLEQKMTVAGMLLGTPAYMSPEQADGADVNTASDVFALGVLLYELLTGMMPIDPSQYLGAKPSEMVAKILSIEAPRPSDRLVKDGATAEAAAALRGTSSENLIKRIKGDLDWIIMKAIEKDRSRRYPSVAKLSEEVNHFLNDEPVEARPPSRLYVIKKFVRRHRSAVITAASIFVVVFLASTATLVSLANASEARRNKKNSIKFLIELFSELEPGFEDDEEEIFDKLSVKLELKDGDPLLLSGLHVGIGNLYSFKDSNEKAIAEYDSALALLDSRDSLPAREVIFSKAMIKTRVREMDQAKSLFEEILESTPIVKDVLYYKALRGIGEIAYQEDKLEEALTHYKAAHKGFASLFGEESELTARTLTSIGNAYYKLKETDEAEKYYLSSISIKEKFYKPDDPRVLSTHLNLGLVYRQRKEYEKALFTFQQVHEAFSDVFGLNYPSTQRAANNIALTLVDMKRYDEAMDYAESVYRNRRRKLGYDHIDTLSSMNNLANIYVKRKEFNKAIQLKEEELQIRNEFYPEEPQTQYFRCTLGEAYMYSGRLDAAINIFSEVSEKLEYFKDFPIHKKATTSSLLGIAYFKKGNFKEAIKYLSASVDNVLLPDLRNEAQKTLDEAKDGLLKSLY